MFVSRRRNGCKLRTGTDRKNARELASVGCVWRGTWDVLGMIRMAGDVVQFELASSGSDHPAFSGAEGQLLLDDDVVGEIVLPPMESYSYEIHIALYGGRSRMDMTVRFPPRARTTAVIEWDGRKVLSSPSRRAGLFEDLLQIIGFPPFRWGDLTCDCLATMAPAERAALAFCVGMQNSIVGQTLIGASVGGAS